MPLPAEAISPHVTLHGLLTGWQTGWTSLVALAVDVALVVWYLRSARVLRAKGRRWSSWRSSSFVAGVATIVVAVESGLASYDDSVFVAHAVQHVLLMNVAPILLALGAPVTLLLQSSGRSTQEAALKVLHHPVVAFVTNPLVVVALASGTMLGFFLTPFYQFSLEHPLVHDLTHLHFLISGCLYWWLVVGIDPSRWRLSYPTKLGFLAVGIPVGTMLGLGLTQTATSVAPAFHSLADTHRGGALLWISSELFTFTALAIVVLQWMRADSREAARADRRADAASARRAAARVPADAGGGPAPDPELTPVVVVDGRFVSATEPGDRPPRSGGPGAAGPS